MSIVRSNLLKDSSYRPYCGNWQCKSTPRTVWTGEQFRCNCCGWISDFEKEFIEEYKKKHAEKIN